jgi:hypothetical protein
MDNQFAYVGFEVLIAVVMKSPTFWGIKPCSPLNVNRYFFLQGRRERQARNKHEVDKKKSLLHAGFLLGLHFDPEDGGYMLLRNVSLTFNGLRIIVFPKYRPLQIDPII